ncbi:MAG: hypothetical protein IKM79_03670 [Bacteroidales bacterium]|jgi:hypothetical protein|nr:hypothetical protein [Bacteroidales bacterium]
MPELQTRQVVARGKLQDIADYLDCSRATLWRRMKDHPECFVRIGRSQVLLVIPQQPAEATDEEQKTV